MAKPGPPLDLDKILEDLDENTSGKATVSLYVTKELWERFKEKVKPHSASAAFERILERLLTEERE